MLSRIKERALFKVASLTRKYQPYRLYNALRVAYNPHKRQKDSITGVVPFDGDLFLRITTGSWIDWHVFFFGGYEAMTRRVIKTILKPGHVAFDVGANIGVHALVMAKAVGQTGTVHCFEAHPAMCERLRENASLNSMSQMRIQQVAVSDAEGTATLYGFDEAGADQGTSSLIHEFVAAKKAPQFTVEATTLDAFAQEHAIERLDFIKIDVEGAESLIWRGGVKTFAKFKPHMVIEYVQGLDANKEFYKEMSAFFSANNYRLYMIGDENTPFLQEIVGSLPGHNVIQIFAVPQR